MSTDSELGLTFKAMKEQSKDKKEHNKRYSTALLINKQVRFESKNNGYHLIIKHNNEVINFWPTTGLWRTNNVSKRGVKSLLHYIGKTCI